MINHILKILKLKTRVLRHYNRLIIIKQLMYQTNWKFSKFGLFGSLFAKADRTKLLITRKTTEITRFDLVIWFGTNSAQQ